MIKLKTYKITRDTIPAKATHPGKLIADEIECRGISQKELADSMNIGTAMLSEIISGERNFTAALAIKLEKNLDIDALTWMRLQVKFEIDNLRIQERDRAKYITSPKTHTGTLPYRISKAYTAVAREPKTKYSKKSTQKGK